MTAPDTTSLVTGVDFVAQMAKDFDRAVVFYGETLGLPRSVHIPDRGFAEFETGNLTISLLDPAKMGIEHSTATNSIARLTRAKMGFSPSPARTRTPLKVVTAPGRAPRSGHAGLDSPGGSWTAA